MRKFLVSSLAEYFAQGLVANHSLHLNFGDCVAEVRSNSQTLIDDLKEYFGVFVTSARPTAFQITAFEGAPPQIPLELTIKEPDPGKTKIKEEYAELPGGRIVRKRLTGLVLLFGQGVNMAFGPCEANANQIVNFVNNRYIELKLNQGCMLGHAAAIASTSSKSVRGLALAGISGAGKSTLALHALSRGAIFVSNDRLLVQPSAEGLLMSGVAKLPRINPGTALSNPDLASVMPEQDKTRVLELEGEELWNLEQKYDVFLDRCFGEGRFVLTAPMNGLLILTWKREGGPMRIEKVDPFAKPELMPAFMKSAGLFYLPSNEHRLEPTLKDYQQLLSRCDVFEASGGVDFDAATDFCLRFLHGEAQS
jgi:HprK-related kinase B